MFKKQGLTILVLVAIVARFIILGATPAHLSNDEIGAAYDAYSISKTLRDEHNVFLPVTFESHGVYRSALAVYLLVPSIMLFGNSDVSARLPSALLGSWTIILVGLFVFDLSKNKKLSLITSLTLAYSPWHFIMSRQAVESNLALFFVVLGIYLFFQGYLHNKPTATIASFVAFAISLYGYYTEWGLTPLVILLLLWVSRKTLFSKKAYVLGLIVFFMLLIPLIVDFVGKLSTSRASTELYIYEPYVWSAIHNQQYNILQKGQTLFKSFFDKYSGYLSLKYIFFNGSHLLPADNPYQIGLFFTPLLVCFFYGFSALKKYFNKYSFFIIAFLLIAPITPALSRGDTSSLRNLPFVVPCSIIIAAGILHFLENGSITSKIKGVFASLMFLNLIYFGFIYFFHYPIQRALEFQYGFEQMARYIEPRYHNYEKIIIDPRFGSKDFYFYGVPHVYIPYYTYMDPRTLQAHWEVLFGIAFDKYEFRTIDWNTEKIQKNYLYSVPKDNIPDNLAPSLNEIGNIHLPNHQVEFRFYSL